MPMAIQPMYAAIVMFFHFSVSSVMNQNNHQSLRQIPRMAHQIIHGSAGEALISKEIKIAACNCKLNALHALNTKLT